MNTRSLLVLLCAFATGSLAACGSSPGSKTLSSDSSNPNAACQPFAFGTEAGARCFLPFPSSYYEKEDATSPTGVRLDIPVGALPKNQVGEDFIPTRYNRLDGWSPASLLLADVGARVDGSLFVGERDDYTKTLQPDSHAQLIDYATGERVAVFAEVDANAVDASQPQLVLIHPMAQLKAGTRYVAVLRDLVDTSGQKIEVARFRALVEGKLAKDSRLSALKPHYDEILALLDKQGVPSEAVTLAWDFTTASDSQSWSNLLTMRDGALKAWADKGLGYTIDPKNVKTFQADNPTPGDGELPYDADVALEIDGTYEVPTYLADLNDDFSEVQLDAAGKPVMNAKPFVASFHLHVPQCAKTATAPLPLLVYGHGNFGSRTEVDSGWAKQTMSALCMVWVATDWIGQSEADVALFGARIAHFDNLSFLFDRMQQGQLNFVVLARLAAQKFPAMAQLAPFQLDGDKSIIDGSQVYYYGNSQGGIYGGTFLALSPDVERGVLGVGGGNYPLMIWRSRDFDTEKQLMDFVYPNPDDQEVLWAMAENLWATDPIGIAPHMIRDPFPDENGVKMPPKRVLLQEGIGDMQVPNVSTRLMARIYGLPQLAPAIQSVYAVEEKAGPLDSAYVQWDFHAEPLPPPTNSPLDKGSLLGQDGMHGDEPDGSTGHSIHESIRRQPEAVEQIKRFLRPDGRVEQTCKGGVGPCDFPKM